MADRPDLPNEVRLLADDLADGLIDTLGSGLRSLFVYGALAFPHPEQWVVDVDFHALVEHPFRNEERRSIKALYVRLSEQSELGKELDGYYVTIREARLNELPRHQLDPAMRDEAWALHRAHVHAGRYFLIRGIDHVGVVPVPTWDQLVAGLRSELNFVEAHPEHGAFGILNSCRILYSLELHDVVVSKYAAAQWARNAFPDWRAAIDTAIRSYTRTPKQHAKTNLGNAWTPIVHRVRQRVLAEGI